MFVLLDFLRGGASILHLFNIEPQRVRDDHMEIGAKSTVHRLLQSVNTSSDLARLPTNSPSTRKRAQNLAMVGGWD
jgi:hypothetical protein